MRETAGSIEATVSYSPRFLSGNLTVTFRHTELIVQERERCSKGVYCTLKANGYWKSCLSTRDSDTVEVIQ